jgi:predicted RNA-binding protein YlqC (UPF0109 family)
MNDRDRELERELKERGLEPEVPELLSEEEEERDQDARERRRLRIAPGKGADDEEKLEDFFRDLVGAYVNYPTYLKLELKQAQRWWSLMVEPDVNDYAIVAGKLGRNFNALKLLVETIAERQGIQIELLLEGPQKNDTRFIRKQLPYRVNPKWSPDQLKEIVVRTLRVAGMRHVKLWLLKNRIVNESNPFDDQTFYWFTLMRTDNEVKFVHALGQLMESMGIAQGQRPTPRSKAEALEKTA